jgi:hypothetical protein
MRYFAGILSRGKDIPLRRHIQFHYLVVADDFLLRIKLCRVRSVTLAPQGMRGAGL